MNATKPAFNPEPMPHIASAEAIDGRRVIIEWASGPRGGISEIVDLSPLIEQMKFYAPLRDDAELFNSVQIADGGEALEWGGGEIDMAATSVERLAEEQMTGREFEMFLERNSLTRKAAAAELGRSIRAIQLYVQSKEPIPRVVVLACKGYEARKAELEAIRSPSGEIQSHLDLQWTSSAPTQAANDSGTVSYSYGYA